MSIKSPFAQRAAAAVLTATLSSGCGLVTKKEGQVLGGAIGAIGGELLGENIENRRLRNTVTAGAAAAGATIGGVFADQNVVCNQESTERRDTNVDYRTGTTTRDTGSASTIEECVGGRTEGTRKPLTGLHTQEP